MGTPRIFFFGDSHTAAIGKGCRKIGLDFAGTMKAAPTFQGDFFYIKDGALRLSDKEADDRLAKSLAKIGPGFTLLNIDIPVVCSLGFWGAAFAKGLAHSGFTIEDGAGMRISKACFDAVVEAESAQVLNFYRVLVKHGRSVFAVPAPTRCDPAFIVSATAFEQTLCLLLQKEGVRIVSTHRTKNTDGRLLPKYFLRARPGDKHHASAEYGEMMARRIARMI